jgi:hypothetical protein
MKSELFIVCVLLDKFGRAWTSNKGFFCVLRAFCIAVMSWIASESVSSY